MNEKIYRYRYVIALVIVLIVMWGWYFIFYVNNGEIRVEDYTWYKSSDQQKFLRFKNYSENEFVRQGYNFSNYIDDLTYSNYTFGYNEENGCFVWKGSRQWQQEVADRGMTNFSQTFTGVVAFDEKELEYVITAQTKSQYAVIREGNNWTDWDMGNDKIVSRCTERELRDNILDIDNQSNKLDNFMSNIITRLKNLFHTKGF